MNAAAILRPQRGFTLVEAIIVMVITGIIAGSMVLFMNLPVQNFVDSAARADMADEADTAMRRIARDLHQALPNSIRTDIANTIEFIPSTAGGRYLSVEDADTTPGDLPLVFTSGGGNTFTVIGNLPSSSNAIVASNSNPQYVVVYNLGAGYASDAYAGTDRAQVTGVNTSNNQITMASNPFAVEGPSYASPTQRFDIVIQPVMYVCANGTLTRYWGYGFNAAEQIPSTGSHAVLASNVVSCEFDATSLAYTHVGLININIRLRTPNSSDPDIQLFNQIHIDNTP